MREHRPSDIVRDAGTPKYPNEMAQQKGSEYATLCNVLVGDWSRGVKSRVAGSGLWVVDHVANGIRLASCNAYYRGGHADEFYRLQMPLLWVCHNFRAVAYSRFFKRYMLMLDSDASKAYGWTIPNARFLERLNSLFHLVAQEARMSISPWDVHSGKALARLPRLPYDDFSFSSLVQLVTRVELRCGFHNDLYFQQLDVIRNLTHLGSDFRFNGEQTIQLIRQNVPTLRFLAISAHFRTDLSGITHDDDSVHVEYPRLQTLVVKQDMKGRMPRRYTSTDAVPFPSLRRLTSHGDRPVGDDLMLFRGNAATLEFLQLTLTRELAVALLQYSVFTPTSHPKLQCVMLKPPPDMASVNYVDNPELVQLMVDIAPGAAVRQISCWNIDQLTRPLVLSLFCKRASLQVPTLPDVCLSIWDAMTLIQSLPLLSDRHAKAPTLDPMPAGVTKRGLISYVYSNYYPIRVQFRCWHIGRGDVELTKDVVNRELRVRLEAVEQITNTLVLRPAFSQGQTMDDEQKPNELALLGNNDVEPLAKRRLDSIRRDVGDTKSTWADLRQLYPPRLSDFAPLTELDDGIGVDGVLSQAATMAGLWIGALTHCVL
ncbi:hypothetical protein GGI19_004533 [Coemansia pectinata]|uniref:Uncharacterized protein n=1 Tax=Coemansia pectinata TaxID=1052879 RepID=A0A9W8GS12_9FUNG|nr:hypothetical protein GGI19_004533 [Coemansia pectinata]